MAENDRALLRRYHEHGDLQAREQLIEQYMSLVRSLARRYAYRGEQFDDLVQIGAIGLIKAIDRFDINRGVELTTYATPNIIGEIKRHFRDRSWAVRVPRGLQELNVQLSKLIEQLTVQLASSGIVGERASCTVSCSISFESWTFSSRCSSRARRRSRSSHRLPAWRRKPCWKRSSRAAHTRPSRSRKAPVRKTATTSTRSSRSARSSTSTRSPKTGRCWRPGFVPSSHASGGFCICASSKG